MRNRAANAGTILHIEDIDLIRLSVESTLSRAGYRVVAAPNAEAARTLWQELRHEIGLIITDNDLPDGSGLDLSRSFESSKPGLPVLVTSGVDREQVPGHFLQLTKPFDCQALLSSVKSALCRAPDEPDAQSASPNAPSPRRSLP